MAKSSSYWDKRAITRMTDAEKTSEAYVNKVKKIYNRANRDIQKQINSVYTNYSKDSGLDIKELKVLLSKKETDKFWKTLEGKGLKQYVKNNYKARISRLEQLQGQLYAKAKEIYPKEQNINTEAYNGVINNSYNKTVYDTQMGTGYDFGFSQLDNRTIDTLLNEPWSGKNYSQRIWGNTDILADKLSTILGGAMISGQSPAKTIKEVRDAFGVSKYYAERLIRTETNHFNNEAEYTAYTDMGLDKYVFVATLDSRTSPMCQDFDGKIFNLKDREVGVNYPPLHPNCRSTVRAYLGEDNEKDLQRRATNPFSGQPETISNMSYKEWLKNHNDNIISVNKNGKWAVNSINKGVNDTFTGAYKMIDLRSTPNKIIYNNMGKLNIRALNDGGNRAFYSPSNNTIHLSQTVNVRNSGTAIHELGHAIDFNLGKNNTQLSLEGNLSKCINEYYDNNKGVLPIKVTNYLSNINNKVEKMLIKTNKYGIIDKDLIRMTRVGLARNNRKYDAPNRLSDMFSALTNGKANDSLFAKHSVDYWKNSGTKETELFAQFTYLKMTNCKSELKVLRETIPDVYNELDKLYIEASKRIRRL